MQTQQSETRLPVYAHWQGAEYAVDLAENQPTPDVGSVLHITVNLAGVSGRLPFKVTGKRQRIDPEREAGMLERLGFGSGSVPTAIDIDVIPHDPEH